MPGGPGHLVSDGVRVRVRACVRACVHLRSIDPSPPFASIPFHLLFFSLPLSLSLFLSLSLSFSLSLFLILHSTFLEKTRRCQEAGAIATIIVDTSNPLTYDFPLTAVPLGADVTTIVIPTLTIGSVMASRLLSVLWNGQDYEDDSVMLRMGAYTCQLQDRCVHHGRDLPFIPRSPPSFRTHAHTDTQRRIPSTHPTHLPSLLRAMQAAPCARCARSTPRDPTARIGALGCSPTSPRRAPVTASAEGMGRARVREASRASRAPCRPRAKASTRGRLRASSSAASSVSFSVCARRESISSHPHPPPPFLQPPQPPSSNPPHPTHAFTI